MDRPGSNLHRRLERGDVNPAADYCVYLTPTSRLHFAENVEQSGNTIASAIDFREKTEFEHEFAFAGTMLIADPQLIIPVDRVE